jgi:phosphate-selective porin
MLLEGVAAVLIGTCTGVCLLPVSAVSQPVPAVAALPEGAPVQDAGGPAQTAKEKKTEKTGESTQQVGTAPGPDRFVWRQRPSFRFGDAFRIDLTLTLHADVHQSYEGADFLVGLRPFDLRRTRVGIQGNLFTRIEYEIERELTEEDPAAEELLAGITPKSPWRDVRADVDFHSSLQVRAGRFKIPFGLDRLTGATNTDFVYRSLGAEYLAPGRDTGVMLHGRFSARGPNYWAGVFRKDGDNARSKKIDGGGQTLAARLTGAPFPSTTAAVGGLVLGGAFTDSALSNDALPPNGLHGRTVMTEDTFFSPVYVDGRRRRWEGDVDWMVGPASVRAEYTYVTDDRLTQGIGNEDLPDARYRSWWVSGTYLVTGETKERPFRPRADLFRGGGGAVELAVRYERLWVDSAGGQDEPLRHPRAETIMPSGDRVVTIGVNWILNRWVTLQINGIREYVEDLDRNPAANGGAFWSRVLRFQVAL